jgi:hypothetical protein
MAVPSSSACWSTTSGASFLHCDPELAEPDHDDVPNLDRVERLPDAKN